MPPVSSRTTSRSTPASRCGLIGEAPMVAACGRTGRRLAYRPSALRIASRPCSGRTVALGSDHFGPPTAPSSTASARLQASSVAGGSGSPCRSIAMPPMSCSLNWKSCPWRAPTARSTSTAAAVTSGPMPSPGSTAISARMDLFLLVLAFVALDLALAGEQVAQFVHAFEQAGTGECIEREGVRFAGRGAQRARRDIDLEGVIRPLHQPLHHVLFEDDREQAVLERVVAEDVGDLAADHGAQAEVAQGPGCVLARRAATEIAPRQQDLAA